MAGRMLSENSFPTLTVIIPFYNSENYLPTSLLSIEKQNYPKIKVIAVNDASTDASLRVIEESKLNIEIINLSKRSGPAYARNVAIKSSDSDLITFLDADDYWSENHLNHSIEYLNLDSELMVVKNLTQPFCIDDFGKTILSNIIYFPFLLGASVYRREVFERVGLFSEDLFQASDADFHLRCVENKIKIHCSQKLSLYYRRHSNNLTTNYQAAATARIAFIKKKLDRERSK